MYRANIPNFDRFADVVSLLGISNLMGHFSGYPLYSPTPLQPYPDTAQSRYSHTGSLA